jgi:hypothetical protein
MNPTTELSQEILNNTLHDFLNQLTRQVEQALDGVVVLTSHESPHDILDEVRIAIRHAFSPLSYKHYLESLMQENALSLKEDVDSFRDFPSTEYALQMEATLQLYDRERFLEWPNITPPQDPLDESLLPKEIQP